LRPVVFIGRSETQNARSYSEQAFSSKDDGRRYREVRWPFEGLRVNSNPVRASKQAIVRDIPDNQARILNDTPRFTAMTLVAPGVRFNALAIFATPFLSLAIDFIKRRSSLVHARLTIFFILANVGSFFVNRLFSTTQTFCNAPR
jgi:hypothetical protein